MKLDAHDLPLLQFSLITTVLMLVLGALAVHFSSIKINAAKNERAAAQLERNNFNGKFKRVHSEESEIREKSATFSQLQVRGMIGDEHRLEWIELLKDIIEKRRLIDMSYEIAPQRPLDSAQESGLVFFVSSMKLQLKLLHEEDLTRFINDLRQHAKALVQIKSCQLSRLPRGSEEIAPLAYLQADCQIDWLTLREMTRN